MIVKGKKLILIGMFVGMTMSSMQCININFLFDRSTYFPLNKNTLLVGGAIAGGMVFLKLLYSYFFVMSVSKAERLCCDVENLVEYVSNHYAREFALLEMDNDEQLKSELEVIILELDKNYPFLAYVDSLKADLDACKKYEKNLCKGVVQIRKSIEKLLKESKSCSITEDAREKLYQEIEQYHDLLPEIARLMNLLALFHARLLRIYRHGLHFDAYQYERLLRRLHAIELQVITNHFLLNWQVFSNGFLLLNTPFCPFHYMPLY